MTKDAYVKSIVHSLGANAWLEQKIEKLFKMNEDAIRAEIIRRMSDIDKKKKNDPIEIEKRAVERIKYLSGLIRGRLFRPAIKNIYLLVYSDNAEDDLLEKIQQVGCNPRPIIYHFSHYELP